MANFVNIAFEEGISSSFCKDEAEVFILTVLKELNLNFWELSVLFCSDGFIHKLNADYRSIDAPTDVLSFNQGCEYIDEAGIKRFIAGDIAISLDTLKKNAEVFNVDIDEELKRLLVHGILHLNGMDHIDNSPEQEMLLLQESILSKFPGIKIIRNNNAVV